MSRALFTLSAIVAAAGAMLPAVAGAAQKVKLDAEFVPYRLGRSTSVVTRFVIATDSGMVPSPVTEVNISLPAGMGFATSALGLTACNEDVLLRAGPASCSPNSHIGLGSALAEVPFGPEVVQEPVSIDAYVGKFLNGHTGIIFYVEGRAPVSAQLILQGEVGEDPQPFGLRLDTAVPLTPSLPGAPDAAVVRMRTSIGPLHLRYARRIGGRTVTYTPKGMVVPRRCPAGGFPIAARFHFEDGSGALARTVIPCPGRQSARRASDA